MCQVVSYHIFGFCLDGRFGFKIGIPGAVTQYIHALLEVIVAEHILKRRVHGMLVSNFGVVGTAFVDDLKSHTVLDRLAHGVFVDVITEDSLGFVYGCAGVAYAGGVRETFIEVGT